MWEQLNRIIKPNGAIVLFGSEPFSSALRMSNIKMFKYDWIWKKNAGSNFAQVKYQPMKEHEIISVFSLNKHNYYPIKQERSEAGKKMVEAKIKSKPKLGTVYGNANSEGYDTSRVDKNLRVPSSVQFFNRQRGLHPTQKPLELLEYLVKTYTNENETVLDFTMGSGSTLVACQNTNRNGIGIEQDEEYFNTAWRRLEQNETQTKLKF